VFSYYLVEQKQSKLNQKGNEEHKRQEWLAYPEGNNDFIGPQDKIFGLFILAGTTGVVNGFGIFRKPD
jgi:hypothetical protein